MFAFEHDGIRADGLIPGKALGVGILPVSMFLATREVMDVFRPGDHGSTFGGNPLAAATGLEALNILVDDDLVNRSAGNGAWFVDELKRIDSPLIKEVRERGLFIGVGIDPDKAAARDVCERLMARGLLSKETHANLVRLAVDHDSLRWAADQLQEVLEEMDATRKAS